MHIPSKYIYARTQKTADVEHSESRNWGLLLL